MCVDDRNRQFEVIVVDQDCKEEANANASMETIKIAGDVS